jgi:TctA family transporter
LLGVAAGLLAAIPGIHVSVLLIALLPLLGIHGEAGAIAITTAVGSGLVASTLSKTFHPATRETLKAATPEQTLAYAGDGLKALQVQTYAIWSGILTVALLSLPLLAIKLVADIPVRTLLDNAVRPIAPLLVIIFFAATIGQASKKLLTATIIVTATILGFWSTHLPALTGNTQVLTPLLGGLFAIPTLLMVLTSRDAPLKFPAQRPASKYQPQEANIAGALGGVATALTAGLGSGAAVSVFAKHSNPQTYLGMTAAAEASNNAFAIILFIVAGLSRSGSAVALKQDLYDPNLPTALLLLTALFIGLTVTSNLVTQGGEHYARLVSHVPQRFTSAVVLTGTLAIIVHETGAPGLAVALAATALGLAAKLYYAPNQSLIAVLAGPVLIYQLGLAEPLARVLNLLQV